MTTDALSSRGALTGAWAWPIAASLASALAILAPEILAAETTMAATDHGVADLRGYGRVEATFSPGAAKFACVDAAHADIVLGKMLADLFWDAGDDVTERIIDVEGVAVTVRAWAPYGMIAIARVGATVMAIGADDEAGLRSRLRHAPGLLAGKPVSAPAAPYPRYLDHYDLRAFKAYTHAMSSVRGQGLDSHWPFIKKFGLGGIAFQDLMAITQCPAPGVNSYVLADYEMRTAEREGGVASIGLGCGGDLPLWMYNRMPENIMRPSPTTLMAAWHGPGESGSHYESWWIPPEDRARGSLRFMREAMERYRSSPALSSWHLYTGAPGGECSFHDRAGEFWDYSPAGIAGFRSWLKTERGFDLASLGTRWYGDPTRFQSWEDVDIPDANGFFGALDGTCTRLSAGWSWMAADGRDTPPAADDAGWIPVEMPPSQQQALLPWGDAFYRVEFDAGDWATRARAWLACNARVRSAHASIAWLNGDELGEQATPDARPLSFPIAGKLKAGRNELILRLPHRGDDANSEGKLIGPVFLTATEPRSYPDLGARANARLVDLRDWQTAGSLASHRAMFDTAMAVDPDHPLILSGDAGKLLDQMSTLGATYGASLQHTGREAWYHPWFPGLGLLAGFYGTSEESGTASTPVLSRELGWIMIDADSNHNLFWDIEDYQLEEQKTGWFTANRRVIGCFGKYLRAFPQVTIFRSSRADRLGSSQPWDWDLGRGELQEAHFDNAYATESELLAGLTDRCPVLLDAGNDIMDDDIVQALRRYVERGGVYIALHQTGLHSSIEPGTQPLSRLTGVASTPHGAGKLRIADAPSVLGAWRGREFSGDGVAFAAIAPQDGAASIGAAPVAVATWEDGGMAIVSRSIGKGRVIQIGSPFWRKEGAADPDPGRGRSLASAFLEHLLGDLGVGRDADASSAHIWARKATTKNGLQDWLVTCNATDAEQRADVRFAVDRQPAEVWDLIERKPVASTYADGFVSIVGVHYHPYAVRIFGCKRASLVDGLSAWWAEKTTYWRRPAAASSPGVAAMAKRFAQPLAESGTGVETIPFNRWRFRADRDGTASGDPRWLDAGFDDSSWSMQDSGPWNLSDPALADWHGTGLYRASFTVPPAWKGRRVILRFYDWDLPIVYDQGEFRVNGTRVCAYQAHKGSQAYAYDVTAMLRDGTNALTVRVQGGKEFAGMAGTVWLEPEPVFSSTTDLSGEWRVVATDLRHHRTAAVPGAPTGRYLAREVALPAAWTGRNVFMHLETPSQWVGAVVVNGRLITTIIYLHPFPPRCDINLSPYLVPGVNRIELWPSATIPSFWGANDLEVPMPVDVVRLGTVDRAP